jgi:GxxExxY protein
MILHSEITDKVIACFYKVYNGLGYGFLEKVYENALMIEMQNAGLWRTQQAAVKVYYEEQEVGSYFADILVEKKVIVEVKAGHGQIIQAHESQVFNYLKATNFEVGLILHFGEKPTFRRVVFSNDFK